MCFEKDCHKDDSTPFLRIGQTLQNSSLHLVKSHNPKSLKIAFFFFLAWKLLVMLHFQNEAASDTCPNYGNILYLKEYHFFSGKSKGTCVDTYFF